MCIVAVRVTVAVGSTPRPLPRTYHSTAHISIPSSPFLSLLLSVFAHFSHLLLSVSNATVSFLLFSVLVHVALVR